MARSENLRGMHPSSCFAARLNRSAKDPVPYSKEALRQDLAESDLLGRSAKPAGTATRSMATSAPCSNLWSGGWQKIGRSAGHVGR